MGVCVACGVRTGKDSGKSFHKFPFQKNPTVAEKWVNWVCKVKRCSWTPSKTSIVCSDHFEASAFDRSTFRVELNTNSIPTIFSSDNNTVTVTEVQAVKRKAPMHEICTDHPLKKHCENSSIISASVTDNCIPDSTALEIYSTPVKFPLEKALDDSVVTPKSSIAGPTDECRTGRRRSLLFHDHNYENTPRTYIKKNNELKENLNKVRIINKVQQTKIKKLKKQVESLKDLVGTLRKEGRVCTQWLECLDSFSDAPRELCMRMIKNINNKNLTREKYPPELRCFALTLHFYSPKAYDYVRRTFDLALPHPTVLRKWYSSVDAEPGFITESFETLQNRVKVDQEKNKHVICSLMLDEMGIKMGTQRGRDGKQRGHVDMGTGVIPGDYLSEAKDALVLMVVGVNASWKLPIGYFLINGIDADTQVNLVTESLCRLKNIGVRVTSLTLDGPPSHLSMLKLLGACIDLPDPKPYFSHPSDPSDKVYVLLDACHMLKLACNCLGEYKVLLDGEGRRIEWRYILELAKLQDDE